MKNLKSALIIGTIFVLITGTLSHFVYDWSGQNFIVGFFSPVNESTWEHMKLSFFPMLLFSVYLAAMLKGKYPCIISASACGILLATFLIPVLFYTYVVDGREYDDDMGRDPDALPRFYAMLKDGALPSTSQINTYQYAEFFEALLKKGLYCPCRLQKIEDNVCMCREFREQIADPEFEGYCHCRLYYKEK